MRLSDEEITAVRNSADIAEVIGHYVPLVKKGRSMACVCPFHDDHDPSLSISQDKQIYKCFDNPLGSFRFFRMNKRRQAIRMILENHIRATTDDHAGFFFRQFQDNLSLQLPQLILD